MNKILFYGNDWEDFKVFVQSVPLLETNGIEVAFGTHNKALIEPLSVGKLLVVNPNTYYDDATIVMDDKKKLVGKNCHYHSDFMGALQ